MEFYRGVQKWLDSPTLESAAETELTDMYGNWYTYVWDLDGKKSLKDHFAKPKRKFAILIIRRYTWASGNWQFVYFAKINTN